MKGLILNGLDSYQVSPRRNPTLLIQDFAKRHGLSFSLDMDKRVVGVEMWWLTLDIDVGLNEFHFLRGWGVVWLS